jgi:hypothetical protein
MMWHTISAVTAVVATAAPPPMLLLLLLLRGAGEQAGTPGRK